MSEDYNRIGPHSVLAYRPASLTPEMVQGRRRGRGDAANTKNFKHGER